MPKKKLNQGDMHIAADTLAESHRGRSALAGLSKLFETSGLDSINQDALITLVVGAYGEFSGSAREAVRQALKNTSHE